MAFYWRILILRTFLPFSVAVMLWLKGNCMGNISQTLYLFLCSFYKSS